MAIGIDQFVCAFRYEWQKRLETERGTLMANYESQFKWTRYMLAPGGLLDSVRVGLQSETSPLAYSREIYTVDAMFVGGEDLFRKDLTYPSFLPVIIEHEHGENIEEEMWKLIFWRSPLKVLIFYDWNERDKRTEKRKKWLERKLRILSDMRQKADSHFPEPHGFSEYLFLVANRGLDGEVCWRWASINSSPAYFIGGCSEAPFGRDH
jgi:hypothetical protein